jgi:hypothetical protein
VNEGGELTATLLLCDAAQVVGGKLYILGGGWSRIVRVQPPLNMALAVRLLIPWHEANKRHNFEARLLTEDGALVSLPQGPVIVSGQFEVGRPPGLKQGFPLDAALAVNVTLEIEPGVYRWDLAVNSQIVANAVFEVIDAAGIRPIPGS